jgi:hypothetical protein
MMSLLLFINIVGELNFCKDSINILKGIVLEPADSQNPVFPI